MDMRVFRNICQEYFDTKDGEDCYVVWGRDGCYDKIVVVVKGSYYATIYENWRDLYKTSVKYSIKDDFDDIGEDEVRDYLDEEAYKYVVGDLGVEINEQI